MTEQRKILFLLLALAAIIFIPYAAVVIRDGGIEDSYFSFPPKTDRPKEPFTLGSLTINLVIIFAITLLFLFPTIYKFRKPPPVTKPNIPYVNLPKWFWLGLVLWLPTLVVLATKQPEPRWLINWALLPLCWGFALFLDGITYKRTGGKSIISENPSELLAMGIASISGWLIFEYYNFFIDLNWYYPASEDDLSHDEFLLYAILGSSGWIPLSFEWYYLLLTFRKFDAKYQFGPKVTSSKWARILMLVLAVAALYVTPYYPQKMFYMIWIAPLIILSVTLIMLKVDTPFASISRHGDWSPLLIFALTWLIQGLLVESWNYISAYHYGDEKFFTYNPAYWQYCIPYVWDYKVFKMPLLGYVGYLPFGLHCWIWWILCSHLFNFNAAKTLKGNFK